jgi:iron complex transport system ATP-binding protein
MAAASGRASGSSSPVVRGKGVRLAYGTSVAVETSDFAMPGAAVTAIIGPNGSGKSTLLHAVAGLMGPLAGSITVLGTDPELARRRVSYVLQSVAVPVGVPISVIEAVGMARYPSLGLLRRPGRVDRERVAEAMAALDIEHLARRHLSELSGGQRQRVYVAQGIAQDHDLLVLDEPLTGLDMTSAQTINRIIRAASGGGRAVVLTTHDLDVAMAADNVLLMAGRVLGCGEPKAVLTRSAIETAYGLGALREGVPYLADPGAHHHAHDAE